ncbi:MAG: ATP-binding protein [Myxococcales bacterium]|nr:ATP-binding protein [Myxococcales bacterium]
MTVDAELRATQVDLGGLMKVLGQNLYSSAEVAVRELVQNAHDSCTRRRLAGDEGFEALITVTPDAAAGTLTITDTGAGLTHDELVRDLATVGAGATGRLREATQTRDLIGAFGLGFLSAYFISERVEVRTTSHRDAETGWLFSSRGGERYRLQPIPARAVGSEVTVHLSADYRYLADADALIPFLQRHCGLLPLPILVAKVRVNQPPPWRQPDLAPLRWRKEALAFAERFDRSFAPLCVVPVEGETVRGVAWVQDGGTYGTTDNRQVAAFVRGMLVDGDARDLLPVWAGFCGAVLESVSLTPTASRESLQTDARYRDAQREVREALIDGLQQVAREDEAAWRRVLTRHNEALLGAALCDDRLFELLAPRLKVPTSQGDLSLEVLRRRTRGRIPVKLGDAGEHEAMLFKAQHIPVVDGTRYAVLPFCEREAKRVGAELVRTGTRAGEAAIFPPAVVDAATQAALEALLGGPGRRIMPTRFSPTTLPLVLVPDHEAALKARLEADEADRRISSAILGLARRFTAAIDGSVEARVFVNLDAPLVRALLAAEGPRQAEVARVLKAIAALFASGGATDVDAAGAFADLSAGLGALL